MDVEIRKAEIEDAELLGKNFWHPLAEEMREYHKVNRLEENAAKEAVNGFKDRLKDESYEFFFLEQDGKEIAYISLERGERPTRELGKYIEVIGLYVKEEYRGEGIGTQLMSKARRYAEEKEADYMTVSAEWKNEKAREFYLKNGFEEKKVKFVRMLK